MDKPALTHSRSLSYPVCALLAIIIITITRLSSIALILHHQYYIVEPDAYMRMFIVSDLLNHHHWFQHIIQRVNPPFGSDTHYWTRAVDILIVIGTWLLNWFMPLSKALYTWCLLLPPLTQLAAALAILWAINALKPTIDQQLFVVIAFLCNPFLGELFLPLNVDYDFLTIILAILFWGKLLRALTDVKKDHHGIFCGIIAALGCWASISFFVIVLLSIVFLIWQYLRNRSYAILLLNFLITLTLTFSLLTGIEQAHFLAVTYDILSIVHISFAALLLVTFIIFNYYVANHSRVIQLIAGALLLLLVVVVMQSLFPGFYRGPYNGVAPYLLTNFFPRITEFFSPFSLGGGIALGVCSYFLLSMALLAYHHNAAKSFTTPQIYIIYNACVLMLLTLYMYRWNNYAGIMNILLMSLFITHIIPKSRYSSLLLVILLAILPSLLLRLSPPYGKSDPHEICLKQLIAFTQQQTLMPSAPQRQAVVIVDTNYTPYLLFTTPYTLIAGNYHHDPAGIKDILQFFNHNEVTAREIARRRGANWLLYCVREQASPQAFITHLARGAPPPTWLQPVALASDYPDLRMYRIVQP